MDDNLTDNPVIPSESETTPEVAKKSSRGPLFAIIAAAVVILAALIVGVVFLAQADLTTTGRIRDIFIIFMALEFLVIGVALIILLVQLATLINLLQNEVKPILASTNETVSTLRGTAAFLSDNLAEPVIKLNEYLAALKRLVDLLHPGRK